MMCRDTGHDIYYHRDTTAFTHADIVTLFFYVITTPVKTLVPAGNQYIEALHK
jgi:hypothetical protein